MIEKTTEDNPGSHQEIQEHLTALLEEERFLSFFGLTKERVHRWQSTMVFDHNEIRFSPGYESAGYGHNQTRRHEMAASSLATSRSTYDHESRHGMHNLKCQTLFEGDDALKYVRKFKRTVLKDSKFIEQIDKPGKNDLQERMLKKVRELTEKENLTIKEVNEHAWMFGALTYQHAYFIDPGICEAVASYGDEGATWAIDEYNRWFATLLLPGRQFFEGYENPKWQEKFKKADDTHKAMLVKSEDYNFNTYWPD